jgi:hypothetical protein
MFALGIAASCHAARKARRLQASGTPKENLTHLKIIIRPKANALL